MSKYGVFSGPYFHVFSPNTGKYGPEKTPYLVNKSKHILKNNFAYKKACVDHLFKKEMDNIRREITSFYKQNFFSTQP